MLTATTATREPSSPHPPDTSATYRAVANRVIVALWIAAILYVVVLSSLVARMVTRPVVVSDPIGEQVMFLLLWAAATPGIIWSAERLPITRSRWRGRLVVHAAIAIAFIIAINIIGPTLTWIVRGRPMPYNVVWRYGLTMVVAVGHLALIVYAFILGAGHYLHTLDVRRQEQLRAERLRADLASAQLRALTLQLQPHFLFNALNAVGALIITERNREAFEVVGRLGDLLRALLAIERREEVSLREELELAQSYVGIEQARLGDRLRVTWEIAPDVGNAQVPPMLLQPLVENAVRHGISRATTAGNLTIGASRAGTRLVLEVRDDGPGPTAVQSAETDRAGLGLENTRRRLTHLYGDDCRLELARDGNCTCVRVELPHHACV